MRCLAMGICPKPARTFGEPHYCKHALGHAGPHICRQCGMELWAEFEEHELAECKRLQSSADGNHEPK